MLAYIIMNSEVEKRNKTQEDKKMTEKAKSMMNMAEALAKINGTIIERLDLQKVHMGKDGEFDHYVLYVWYSDGKEIRIRQDCTVIIDK